MEGSWHQLVKLSNIYSTNTHLLFQTYILHSSGNAPVALPIFASLRMVFFSPQLWLVQPVLPHASVLLQKLQAYSGDHSAGEQRVTLLGSGGAPGAGG